MIQIPLCKLPNIALFQFKIPSEIPLLINEYVHRWNPLSAGLVSFRNRVTYIFQFFYNNNNILRCKIARLKGWIRGEYHLKLIPLKLIVPTPPLLKPNPRRKFYNSFINFNFFWKESKYFTPTRIWIEPRSLWTQKWWRDTAPTPNCHIITYLH